MGAAVYLLRTWSTRRVGALIGVALVAAATLGMALLASLGALRAATGWDTLIEDGRGEAVMLDITTNDGARRLAPVAAQLDGVEAAVPLAYSYLTPDGRQDDFFGGVILPLGPGAFESVWRPLLLDGRAADREAVDEVVVNVEFTEVTGLGVGDEFTLVDPIGLISQPMQITGVGVLPVDFTFAAGASLSFPTLAFVDKWTAALDEMQATLGLEAFSPGVVIDAAADVSVADVVHAVNDGLPARDIRVVNASPSTTALVVDTLALQRDGYLALATIAGLAALALIALLFAGAIRLSPTELVALQAVGFGQRDLTRVGHLAGLAVVVVGTMGALVVALLFEGTVPTGLAERVGAPRALRDDASFLAGSAVAIALALGLIVTVAARGSTRRAREDAPSRGLGLLRWPAVGLGLRYATGGSTRSGRRRAGAAVLAVLVASVGVSAVGVVIGSRDDLLADPARVGKFFDVYLYSYPDPRVADADRATLAGSDAVAAVATITLANARVNGQGAGAISVAPVVDGLAPPVLDGRLPTAEDEVAVSRPLLRRMSLDVGDAVDVGGAAGSRRAEIVGTTLFPFIGATAAQEEILMTPAGLEAIGAEVEGYALAVDLRNPAAARQFRSRNDQIDACAVTPLLELLAVDHLEGPDQGLNLCVPRGDQRSVALDELGEVPMFIVAFLMVLGAIGLAFVLTSSTRAARRDLATVRSIGFTRLQTATTLLVQAAAVALVGSLVALPLGVAVGRVAWRGPAEAIGVSVRPTVSPIWLVAVVAGALVVALLIALPMTRRSVAGPPAEGLRPD